MIMKLLFIFIFILLFSGNFLAQRYEYRLKLENVYTLAQSKEVTVYLRPIFNSEEEPNKFFPNFNLESAEFNFKADAELSKKELEDLLGIYGYMLISYYREQL